MTPSRETNSLMMMRPMSMVLLLGGCAASDRHPSGESSQPCALRIDRRGGGGGRGEAGAEDREAIAQRAAQHRRAPGGRRSPAAPAARRDQRRAAETQRLRAPLELRHAPLAVG